jgi:putative peptide zinc metalloprotease protein
VSSHSPPLPLCARRDLKFQETQFQGESWQVVKDPLALQYYRLRENELRVLELLDGTRSINELLVQIRIEFPTIPTSCRDLQLLITDLSRKGLIRSSRTGRAPQILGENSRRRGKRLLATLLNPLFIKLPGWDPQPILEHLAPLVRWMFQPWAVCLTVLFILASWLQLAVRFDAIQSQMPALASFITWPNILLLWITLGATKVIHELAHGLACHHFGGECHEIGVAFMVFSPCLYCDVSDSWMLPAKRDRILIAAAGICIEVLISAIALFLWSWTRPGLLNVLLMNTFLVTAATTVICNANPLLRFDGYYMLADWLEIPNLRSRADAELRRFFLRVMAGLHQPEDFVPPARHRFLFISYAFCSLVYRWVMVIVFTGVVFHFLKPVGLQNMTIAALGLSVGVSVYRFAAGIRGQLNFAGGHSMKPARMALALVTVVGVISASLMLPIPVRGHAPLVLEPAGMRNVYSQVDGVVQEILATPGARVRAGQPLIRLRNEALDLELAELQTMLRKRQVDAALARATNDSARLELAIESVGTVEEKLNLLRQKLDKLTIAAPCDGVLIEPAASESMENHVPDQNPLDAKNQGAWLVARTHVCSIAPKPDEWQAMLFIDHAGHEKMKSGDDIEINLADRPQDILHGRVVAVAPREENLVPASLSLKHGGPMATTTDLLSGGERVAAALYQATVVIHERDPELFTGLRGTGRFQISRSSVMSWISACVRRSLDVAY